MNILKYKVGHNYINSEIVVADVMKLFDVCPRCFSESGFSIVLEEEKGIYNCPKCAQHRFVKNADGFFEEYRSF